MHAIFSTRVPGDLRPNRLTAARESMGQPAFDLTVTNPSRCGLACPTSGLERLADAQVLDYWPDPRGGLEARRAVAATYREWGAEVDPSRVVLTASTSEAYSFLFRLLADPGQCVLVPCPSYPLFEQLARLDAIQAVPYHLDPDACWRIDHASFTDLPEETRAVVVVHPNNPTGSWVHPEDTALLRSLCAERGWALIADEVFLPYPLSAEGGRPMTFASEAPCLSFTLGGLSKSAGLPGLKLAWIVVGGPHEAALEALERLDHIADAYLSVGTPVTTAAAALIEAGRQTREAILVRCRRNLRSLLRLTAPTPALSVPLPDGGWSAVLRVPTVCSEEALALSLLEEGVAVSPGYFFDFPNEGYLVLSLLPPEHVFEGGVERLTAVVRRLMGDTP